LTDHSAGGLKGAVTPSTGRVVFFCVGVYFMYKKIKLKDGTTIDEHRIIMNAEKMGNNNVVHHIDGNKKNNNPKNLKIMTRKEHSRMHMKIIASSKEFKPDASGNAICRRCKKLLPWNLFRTDKSYSHGKASDCKKCNNEYRSQLRRSKLVS